MSISYIFYSKKSSRWNHPKSPTRDTHPKLFDHVWTLNDLLNQLEVVDREIQADMRVLGINALLREEPLFKVIVCFLNY